MDPIGNHHEPVCFRQGRIYDYFFQNKPIHELKRPWCWSQTLHSKICGFYGAKVLSVWAYSLEWDEMSKKFCDGSQWDPSQNILVNVMSGNPKLYGISIDAVQPYIDRFFWDEMSKKFCDGSQNILINVISGNPKP